jgi:uncharacterized protein YjbI with pentapeptide repeats
MSHLILFTNDIKDIDILLSSISVPYTEISDYINILSDNQEPVEQSESLQLQENDTNIFQQQNILYKFTDEHFEKIANIPNIENIDTIAFLYENMNISFPFEDFINILSKYPNIKTYDIITCNIKDSGTINKIHDLENTHNITIRYSIDLTGSLVKKGNWVLESHNVNIKDIYFNKNIDNWYGILNSDTKTEIHEGFVITFQKKYKKSCWGRPYFIWEPLPLYWTQFVQTGSIIYDDASYNPTEIDWTRVTSLTIDYSNITRKNKDLDKALKLGTLYSLIENFTAPKLEHVKIKSTTYTTFVSVTVQTSSTYLYNATQMQLNIKTIEFENNTNYKVLLFAYKPSGCWWTDRWNSVVSWGEEATAETKYRPPSRLIFNKKFEINAKYDDYIKKINNIVTIEGSIDSECYINRIITNKIRLEIDNCKKIAIKSLALEYSHYRDDSTFDVTSTNFAYHNKFEYNVISSPYRNARGFSNQAVLAKFLINYPDVKYIDIRLLQNFVGNLVIPSQIKGLFTAYISQSHFSSPVKTSSWYQNNLINLKSTRNYNIKFPNIKSISFEHGTQFISIYNNDDIDEFLRTFYTDEKLNNYTFTRNLRENIRTFVEGFVENAKMPESNRVQSKMRSIMLPPIEYTNDRIYGHIYQEVLNSSVSHLTIPAKTKIPMYNYKTLFTGLNNVSTLVILGDLDTRESLKHEFYNGKSRYTGIVVYKDIIPKYNNDDEHIVLQFNTGSGLIKISGKKNISEYQLKNSLEGTNFHQAEFNDYNFSGFSFKNCRFTDCKFTSCVFEGSFENVYIENADFTGSVFTNVSLKNAILSSTSTIGIDVSSTFVDIPENVIYNTETGTFTNTETTTSDIHFTNLNLITYSGSQIATSGVKSVGYSTIENSHPSTIKLNNINSVSINQDGNKMFIGQKKNNTIHIEKYLLQNNTWEKQTEKFLIIRVDNIVNINSDNSGNIIVVWEDWNNDVYQYNTNDSEQEQSLIYIIDTNTMNVIKELKASNIETTHNLEKIMIDKDGDRIFIKEDSVPDITIVWSRDNWNTLEYAKLALQSYNSIAYSQYERALYISRYVNFANTITRWNVDIDDENQMQISGPTEIEIDQPNPYV